MIIKSLFFKDDINGLCIEETSFSDLTIFVGTSGAGKTTIMDSLATVVGIAKGLSSPGDEWDLKFFDNEHRDIRWQGKFSSEVEQIQSDENYEDDDEDVAKVESESLTIDGKEVFKRNDNLITYNGEKLPQIEKHKSLLYVFRDDNLIEKVYSSLISIKIASSHSREFTDLRSIPLVYIKSDSTINDLINTGKRVLSALLKSIQN